MRFYKAHALGNDFLIIRSNRRVKDLPALARAICDRHFGIGADGLVIFAPARRGADFSMRIFNADGSEAEISGNGLRCLTAVLYQQGLAARKRIRIGTKAGIREARLLGRDGNTFYLETNMGRPSFAPAQIPFSAPPELEQVIDYPLRAGDAVYKITALSMGNPHCVVFCDNLLSVDVKSIGPLLEKHASFPLGANVEFVQVLDRRTIEVLFWERGVGPTFASGTGSSAAAVAAVIKGLADEELTVITGGGRLNVLWPARQHVILIGPATIVCQGRFNPWAGPS